MNPTAESFIRDEVFELGHGLSCLNASRLFTALDTERVATQTADAIAHRFQRELVAERERIAKLEVRNTRVWTTLVECREALEGCVHYPFDSADAKRAQKALSAIDALEVTS